MNMKVLFIGATGRLGQEVVPFLSERHELSLAAFGGGEMVGRQVHDLDITDLEALSQVLKNEEGPFDAIVNCAIAPYRNVNSHDHDQHFDYFQKCFEINARGAWYIYEAAALAGVPKVVYISSMSAVMGNPTPDRVDASTRDQPADMYAACKIFGEHSGRYYAHRPEAEGPRVNVICLRLGNFHTPDQAYSERRFQSVWYRGLMSDTRDVASAIDCALKADIQYGVYTIVSDADPALVDQSMNAELGYKPGWKSTPEGMLPVE
jgi:nucleoside-diphosphate-sugar epimerase